MPEPGGGQDEQSSRAHRGYRAGYGRRCRAAASTNGNGASSRQRVEAALAHLEADVVPLDLGGWPSRASKPVPSTGSARPWAWMPPGTPVKVIEPYQMLGEMGPDLADALGVDVVGVGLATNMFGFKNEGWKPWTLFDGTPVLVPGSFNTDTEPRPRRRLLMYPEGDTSVPPSARMPKGGFYFDALNRQGPIDDDHLDVEDNLEEFGPISDEDLEHIAPRGRPAFPDRQGRCSATSGARPSATSPWSRP